MRSLDARLRRLERELGTNDQEMVIRFISYSDASDYPSEEEQIAQQRSQGEKWIVVYVPWQEVEQEA